MTDDLKKGNAGSNGEQIPAGYTIPSAPATSDAVAHNTRRIESLEKQRNAAVYGLLGILILSLAFFYLNILTSVRPQEREP